MQKLIVSLLMACTSISLAGTPPSRHYPPGANDVYISDSTALHIKALQQIAPLVQSSIANGFYPGAVILAGHQGHIIYRGVFGNRRVNPSTAPMRFDTIFDLASLTKVIVATTAIMQLVDQDKIQLDKPVAYYWPVFAANGKSAITVRQLLTHTSGLQEDIPSPELNEILPLKERAPNAPRWHGKEVALQKIAALQPLYPPGSKFSYSDVNFITLGYLVERLSGERLNHYAMQHIFKPLGMNDSYFLPQSSLHDRIAPTEILGGQLRWGTVHDPTTYLMGGVSGMAGLFSDAHDLGIFAQMVLDHGRIADQHKPPRYILTPASVKAMTTPQTPKSISETRGLGWDINSHYTARGHLFASSSFGHTGWTGTSLWIDPASQTWLIILTNRLHPKPAENKLIEDRGLIADWVARAVGYTRHDR